MFPAYTLKTSCNRYNYCIPDNMSICIVNILELITIKKAHKPLNAVVAKKVTVDEVNAAMKAAATESFGYNTEQIVSSDIVGMRFGSLFDATQTMVNELPNGGCQVQVVSWYDNENSYTSQMVRTIKYFAELN